MIPERYKIIIRYIVSGGAGALVQFLCFYFFSQVLGLWYLYAVFLAFFFALIAAFCLQKFWTFHSFSRLLFKKQFLSYTTIAVFGILLNALLMYGMVSLSGANPAVSQAVTIVVITPVSFLLNKKVTFVT